MTEAFNCFDDNDDDDDDLFGKGEWMPDPNNGILSFHAGTEMALLVHVQNEVTAGQPKAVLRSIDGFCSKRHWMMHIGPDKGQQLRDFLWNGQNKYTVVELGTYCGYSSILFADTLLDLGVTDFHVFTVEVNPLFVRVAQSLVRHAGIQDHVSVLLLEQDNDDLVTLLAETGAADLVFLDHDKRAYLPDLLALESSGLIRKGTRVAADNVVFAQIHDYRRHMQRLAAKGVVQTQLREGLLEYSQPWSSSSIRDGIELTVYLKDPT